MATPQEIIADPNFLALSPDDRRHVLATVDPIFAALSPSDQTHVVTSFGGGQPDAASKARQHLASIAAGADVPHGAMQPANPDEPLSAWTNAAQQPTDKAGNPLPMGGGEATSVDRLKQAGASAVTMASSLGSQRPDLIAENVVMPMVEGAQHEGRAAKAAWNRPGVGGKVEAVGHAVAAALPGIGPAAAAPAEDFAAGNIGGAVGGVAALAAPAVLGEAVPAAVRGVAGSTDAAGTAIRAAGDRLGAPLFDAEGKFTPQAEALVRELHDRNIRITDPKAQAKAAAEAIAKQAEDAGVTLKTNKVADMADALPETKPLNAGRRLAGIGVKAGVDTAAHAVAGPLGPIFSEMAMEGLFPDAARGGAIRSTAALARDFVKSGAIRKWGSNTLAKWGNALKANDPGALAAAASEGDQAAAGISDPAYGAVSHLGTDELHAIYTGAPALYIAPDGSQHQIDVANDAVTPLAVPKRSSNSPEAEWPPHNSLAPNENDAMLQDVGKVQALLPDQFAKAKAARLGGQYPGKILDAPDASGLWGAKFPSGHMDFANGEYGNNILLSRDATGMKAKPGQGGADGYDVMTNVLPHELGHAAWHGDLTDEQRAAYTKLYQQNLAEAQAEARGGMPMDQVMRRHPLAILSYASQAAQKPDTLDPVDESFSEMFGQFMANPSAFKAAHPREYGFYRGLFGREYIQQKKAS